MANAPVAYLRSDSCGHALLAVPTLGADQNIVMPAAGGNLAIVGGITDMLSNLLNAEVTVTAAGTTCVADTWYKCTAASADYAITLPAVASNTGKFVGIRVTGTSTFLVTITGNGAELIDGLNTRVLWANEVAVLYCDGATWTKVAGKSIPMASALLLASNQTFSAAATTLLNYKTALYNFGPASMSSPATPKITVKRPGQYRIRAFGVGNNTNASINRLSVLLYKNGSPLLWGGGYSPATTPIRAMVKQVFTLAAGDFLQTYGLYSAGSYTTSVIQPDATGSSNQLSVVEIPTW